MPTYEFMTDDGRILEAVFPMAEAPPLGEIRTIDDPAGGQVKATRIPSSHQVQGDPWIPYVSNVLPRNIAGVPCTPSGKPIITTKAQERDICAKYGYERD